MFPIFSPVHPPVMTVNFYIFFFFEKIHTNFFTYTRHIAMRANSNKSIYMRCCVLRVGMVGHKWFDYNFLFLFCAPICASIIIRSRVVNNPFNQFYMQSSFFFSAKIMTFKCVKHFSLLVMECVLKALFVSMIDRVKGCVFTLYITTRRERD